MKRVFLALTLAFAACAVRAGEGLVRTAERPAEAVGWTQTAFAAGDVLVLRPFDGVELALTILSELPGFDGARTYAAALPDGLAGSTLVVGADGLYADVRDVAAARLYRIAVRNGVATAEEIDLTAVRRGGCIEAEPPDGAVDSTGAPAETTRRATRLTAVAGNPFDGNVVAPAPVTVDIMLVFDNGARAWVESSAKYTSITNFAVAQVAKMNSVLLNTGLHTNFWYRLVDVMTVDTTYTVIDENILGTVKAGAESGEGVYGPIKERRAACGADLVSLMIDTGTSWGTTGIGYITHGTTYNTWLGYRAWCYSACAIRSVDLEYTLSHEVGHNMGLAHSPTLAGWTKPGTFDYSNGYNFWGKDDKKPYHTIMAYDQDRNYTGYIEIPYFSSPDYTYQGTVIGTVLSNDCTRALRETCAAFAAWHETAIPLPSDVTFSPSGSEAYRITLSNLGGYEIRYTTDGSEPTRDSVLYSGPILLVGGSMTVKAVAVVDDKTLGAVATKTYSAAVELDDYVILKELYGYGWSSEYWDDQDGNAKYAYYWNTSSDKTAVVDASGVLTVNRNIDLGMLVANGTNSLEIVATDNALFATNLHVMGNTTLTGDKFSFENWNIHSDSTLALSPGEGNTVTLNKYLAQGATGSTLAISNGTLSVTRSANIYDGIATLQNCALRIDNGGILSLEPGWVLGYANPNPVTVNEGGLLKLNGLESTTRPLVLNGGNVEVYKADNRGYEIRRMQVTVTDDSTIADKTASGVARMSLVDGDSTFTVSDGKTLTVDMGTYNEKGIFGIVKKGLGEVLFLRELGHLGTNTVSAGTFTVGYNSTTTNCTNWIVARDATLKVANGCSLVIPQIELSSGAVLSLPAASAAPLAVSNSVALAGVAVKLSAANNLSLGAAYPLVKAENGFTGIVKIDKSQMPALAGGLAWKFTKDAGGVLWAIVANEAEAKDPITIVGVDDSLALEIPDDATTAYGAVTVGSNPLVVDSIGDTAVAVTLDVELPETSGAAEQTICSWIVEDNNVVRCVRRADGVLDVFYGESGHAGNITNSVVLASGRHTIKIGYNYGTYGGTWVFADDKPAYWATDLKWHQKAVRALAIGATADDEPQYPFAGLVLRGLGILKANSSLPLPNMTGTSGIAYNYLIQNNSPTNAIPAIFPNAVAGGFSMDNSLLDASLPNSADSITVSIVASFPADKPGCLLGVWAKSETDVYSYPGQIDYNGDGSFSFSRNGYVNTVYYSRVNSPDASVESPHLYTLEYRKGEGFGFYQDGVQILTASYGYVDNPCYVFHKVVFGRGPWNKMTTSYDDNENPISGFKVYASHIELGSDDRSVSEAAVMASLNFDAAYDGMTIAKKLSYLPACQTATGVAAPSKDQEEDPDPAPPATPAVVDILVAYDNGAQAYVANKGITLEAFAQTQINKMNDVLVTNKLDRYYSYRLAGTCKVDATYPTVESVSGKLVSGAGPLVTLRAARELYGADTVTLLVNASGGATLGDSIPLSHSTDVASRHDCAFSVCSISAVDTGTQHTMIHENAHNMGCGHARQQSAINSPFEYGRGYYFMDGTTKRHTIMAYDVDGTGVYAHPSPYFSTTSKEFGFVLGDKTNNNARVLKETCGEVAKWRTSVVPDADDVRVFDESGNEILSDCFFNDSLKVTVVAPVEGAELYYTFDGSEPIVDEGAFHQPSPFTFNFTVNRTLKIAYKSGETLSPVRTIRFTKTDNVPTNGLWQTCLKYPWTLEGDTIRSYNQTDYTYPCATPLKATIAGPKRMTFKHKSYFGGAMLAGDNYSHFDVLLDDSPVLAQTECTNDWTVAEISIPEGMHEVTFVFLQHFAMNNPADNKDGAAADDDAVWLKDFELTEIEPETYIPSSSTESRVSWNFPSASAKAQGEEIPSLAIGEAGIVESLDFGSTNIVVMSALASLPESGEGALMGLVDAKGTSRHPIFIYANGDGTFTLYYDNKAKTASSISSGVMDMTGLHVWTLRYDANNGGRFYCDGVEVASDTGIKWTGNNNLYVPSESLTFGSADANSYPLTGAKIYAVHSDFGSSATVSDSVSAILAAFDVLDDFADEDLETRLALLGVYRDTGSIPSKTDVASTSVLRVSEIMPKPTDAQNRGSLEGMDVNGLESGWVEVENTSDQWADLADYRFIRVNRGKKTDPAGVGNFPSYLVPPRSRAIFYTSERYSNSKDQAVSAFAEGTFDGKPMIMGEELHNILVWGDKVNPKKSPYVRLYYAPGGEIESVVDTVVIPSDVPEGYSIIVGEAKEGEGTRRWLCPTPTRGAANGATVALTRLGPNVGPLYEKKGQKKTDHANEFAVPVPPAKPGEDYVVTLPINGVMNPDGSFTPRAADKIQSLKFVFRKDLDDATLTTNNIDMATKTTDANWGDRYTATIPSDFFPEAGHLIQWKVLITDGEGVEWTSPSFNNPDDGYEWYGTIVEPDSSQMSATLPTWHMFADSESLEQMDVDASAQTLENNARVAIYDSSTSNYYDYVRIDLRGNTSAKFTKKSHGLRFAKAHPLTMVDCVTGETIKEIRKTSLISEFADPSYMRQMIAFWLWRKMGNLVPFDFPVRCNLNGKFYQLAFNSERFTDELIEDVYGLDKYGYSYKNVGTMKSGSSTTAGEIEKKTPDDEDESNITVLESELRKPLYDNGAQSSGENIAALTKFVVKKFNLPAWINYLASARITQEMDDVWANVSAYYDNAEMHSSGGTRGTDTWMPLGYDFNLSLGQYYRDSDVGGDGLFSTNDWFKSHPFYGGNRVRCYSSTDMASTINNGNDGFEAVWQSQKFRRLYLRRLRTLMDAELKAPGTPESEVPFMAKMRELANMMRADAALDQQEWPNDSTDDKIDVWKNRPANIDAGIDDIWDNYVVPRREHLYVTHSITNTAKEIGYGSSLNAGIPEAQSAIEVLSAKISLDLSRIADGVAIISNGNSEVVDMSGWTLRHGIDWTLPAGTVCDSNDCIYVVADRRGYVAAHESELTDQVIIGNAKFVESAAATVIDSSDGTRLVLQGAVVTDSPDTIEFAAASQAEADAHAEAIKPTLTQEDEKSGLDASYLKVVANPSSVSGIYTLAVDIDSGKVPAPAILQNDQSAASGEGAVVFVDAANGKTVTITIGNAIKGLWYGYEVSDALGDASAFANDVDSFMRATDAKFKLKASSPRAEKEAGFYRVKALPAKPTR